MDLVNRRRLLAGTAVAGGFAAGIGAALGPAAFADPHTGCPPPAPAAAVAKHDPRYPYLVSRGKNGRFTGRPDNVHIVSTTEQVAAAVTKAVKAGHRIAVRSGGHCFEDFVDSAEVQAVIDLSGMTNLYFDEDLRAFAVEPGLRLGEVYRRLHLGWNVTIPAGSCTDVGVGGHILGGGYGALARKHGLVVDHLYAVEVVVVNAAGEAETIVATRDSDDPNRDLWWAHTGGGGGNFGIVTRYWLRSPGAEGTDPSRLLPRPPDELLTFSLLWDWSELDEESFLRLVRNHGDWHTANSAPDSRFTGLHTALMLNEPAFGPLLLVGTIDGDDDAEGLLEEYAAALTEGVAAEHRLTKGRRPWLNATLEVQLEEGDGRGRVKAKAGYLRRGLDDEQIGLIHAALNEGQTSADSGLAVWLVSYGGKVSEVKPSDTAAPQRDSVLKAIYLAGWTDPDQDAANLERIRRLYQEIYAASGGVPAPDERNDGCFINYPDTDLADPELNTSGVAWHTLYYKDCYPRLREVKAAWDPRDVFTHRLGIRPAE